MKTITVNLGSVEVDYDLWQKLKDLGEDPRSYIKDFIPDEGMNHLICKVEEDWEFKTTGKVTSNGGFLSK